MNQLLFPFIIGQRTTRPWASSRSRWILLGTLLNLKPVCQGSCHLNTWHEYRLDLLNAKSEVNPTMLLIDLIWVNWCYKIGMHILDPINIFMSILILTYDWTNDMTLKISFAPQNESKYGKRLNFDFYSDLNSCN